jgi:hypothetical protein
LAVTTTSERVWALVAMGAAAQARAMAAVRGVHRRVLRGFMCVSCRGVVVSAIGAGMAGFF